MGLSVSVVSSFSSDRKTDIQGTTPSSR